MNADSKAEYEVLSEWVAHALRQGDYQGLGQKAPLIACTYQLLKHMGWMALERDLIEALPHFSQRLGVQECQNVWVALGYDSRSTSGLLSDISSQLYPCIFVADSGECFVVMARQGRSVDVYNPATHTFEQRSIASIGRGTAYLFNSLNAEDGQSKSTTKKWFFRLVMRFKRHIAYLMTMSVIINLIALTVPFFIMAVYDRVIGAESANALPMLLVGIVVALSFDFSLRWVRGRLLGRIAGRIDYLVGVEAYKKVISLAPVLTERSSVSAQLSRLKQFDSVREFFTGTTASTLLDLPYIPIFIAVLAMLGGWVAVVPFAVALVLLLLSRTLGVLQGANVSRTSLAKSSQQRMQMQTLDGRNEIAACQAQDVWMEQYRRVSAESAHANYRASAHASLTSNLAQGVAALGNVAVLVIGALMIIDQNLTVGALIAIMVLMAKVIGPIQQVFLNETRIKQTLSSIRQIDQLMALEHERAIRAQPRGLDHVKGLVQVDKASFRYSPSADPALMGVSLAALPGQLVVITGETGSGKSSLIKLIAGMYRPQSGAVTLDTLDVRQIGAKSLRRLVAYVPQTAQLFHGSLAQNIRMNNLLATDDDLKLATQAAGIYDEIMALPKGFSTHVGDAHTEQLAPGFVRAISLARAFVSEAQVILLDEPGSSVDRLADSHLMAQLHKLKRQRTVIMATHRPSHIAMADHVLILDRGAMKFSGEAMKALEILKGGVSAH